MDIKRKLTSRKLWAALAGVVTGLSMAFGLDQNIITTVSGAIVSVFSVVTYIITEGQIDKESIGSAVNQVQDAVDILVDSDNA